MDSIWPEAIAAFEAFLERVGLTCQGREEFPAFGNKLVQYAGAGIGVRVGSDRGEWFVEIADLDGNSDKWYDAAIVRDLVLGPGEDVLPLGDQIEFVERNWSAIVSRFGPVEGKETHARLAILRKERAMRLFPGMWLSPYK
jgi:hypothetical protein